MNVWAGAALGFRLLAIYVAPLRKAMHFGVDRRKSSQSPQPWRCS